jgi:hypothetical protein
MDLTHMVFYYKKTVSLRGILGDYVENAHLANSIN